MGNLHDYFGCKNSTNVGSFMLSAIVLHIGGHDKDPRIAACFNVSKHLPPCIPRNTSSMPLMREKTNKMYNVILGDWEWLI